MERHFAALSLPDPANDSKITRAISFSELPSTRRILIEQCYQTDGSGTLVRQYSCERILDKSSNLGDLNISQVLRTGSERCLSNVWTTLPVFGTPGYEGWRTDCFGTRAVAADDKPRRMESMEVDEIEFKPFASNPEKKATKRLPIMELNGMTLSDGGDRAMFKSSTCGSLRMGDSGIFVKPPIRSRSASPNKCTDRPVETEPSQSASEDTASICDYDEAKKKLRSLVPEVSTSMKKSRFSRGCARFIFFSLLPILALLLAGILSNEDSTKRRSLGALSITNLSKELGERVYGQERAIDQLIDALAGSTSGINLIGLIGGTGVGKSYTIGIVAKHFSSSGHVLEYFSPIGKTIHEAFNSFSHGRCNLVILENLKGSDLQEVARFFKFTKEHTRQLCVCVIAVFNPQETDEELRRRFDPENSVREFSSFFPEADLRSVRTIVFEDLGERSLDACIRQAAIENGVELSGEKLTEIRTTLLMGSSGCKGAYAKIQLLVDS